MTRSGMRTAIGLAFSAVLTVSALAQPTPSRDALPAGSPGAEIEAGGASAPGQPIPPAPRSYFDGVQVTIDGKAASSGLLGIEVQYAGGTPKVIWARVHVKSAAAAVAEELVAELRPVLGPAYRIQADGGRVRITKENRRAPPVSAAVVGLSAFGIGVKLEEY